MFCHHEKKHLPTPKTPPSHHPPPTFSHPSSRLCRHRNPASPLSANEKIITLGTACHSSPNTGSLNFPKTFFFQICRLDGGFLILILPYVAFPQCRTIFQVSHSVSASSAPYRLSDALNRHIPGLKSTLLLRRRKGIDGLEIHRSPARRAADALRRHLAHGFDILLPARRKDLPFSLNVLGMGFDTA